MYEEFYEITNWIEINTKSDQPRYSELVAANNYVKDYESIYASACPEWNNLSLLRILAK